MTAFARGARQHAIFRGDPAFTAASFMRRNFFIDAGGTNDLGVAAFNQDRAFGVFGIAAGKTNGAQFIERAAAGTHKIGLVVGVLIAGNSIT